MTERYEWRVSKAESGGGLLQFLRDHCPLAPSVKALKRAIDQKLCSINGQIRTFSSYRVQEGDVIRLLPGAFESKKALIVRVLYEDADLLVVFKPAGMLSESAEIKQFAPYLVHRLDKETSGALILAKTEPIQSQMQALFKEHQVRKVYLALVDGVVEKEEGTIDNYLGKKGGYAGQTIYGKVESQKGVRAVTHWRRLSYAKMVSLVQCEPRTGRTHQIRVHLSGMGHPILGDRQYAAQFRSSYQPGRNLLHAYSLEFPHPRTHKSLKVIAPIPVDFKQALEALGLTLKRAS